MKEIKEKLPKFKIRDSLKDVERIDFNEVLSSKNPIIFDTNFLFITFEFRIDIIAELQRVIGSSFSLYIYEGTISELENIENKKDKNKKFLPLISTMIKRYGFKIIKSNLNYIDEQILSNLDKRVLIGTNDKALRKRIKEKGVKVMYTRQKSYLEISS
jgi:hypothetical protein